MMKSIFIFTCALFLTFNVQAQKKIPAPAKRSAGPQHMKVLQQNPLEGLYIAFKSDPVYITTDTAFIVQESSFIPEGSYVARINIENTMYPANFTKDSLEIRSGYVNVARETIVTYLDGVYRFDGKYPKQSKQLIFTDNKEKKNVVFNIIWDAEKTGITKKNIKSLLNTQTSKVWSAAEPYPLYPSL